MVELADAMRDAGHVVHTPDLYEGRTFGDIPSGVDFARSVGFENIIDRGRRAAEELPSALVYAGMSLGVLPAEMLAMRRPGAKGALLLYGCVPLEEFGGVWPSGIPLQMHLMEDDPEGDVPFAREVAATVPDAELVLYPGNRHLFADSSVPAEYDEAAATMLRGRLLKFLERLG